MFKRTATPLLRDRSSSQRTAGGLHRTQSGNAEEACSLAAASLHGLLQMGLAVARRNLLVLRFNGVPSRAVLFPDFQIQNVQGIF